MTNITSLTLEVDDLATAETFYRAFAGSDLPLRVVESSTPTTGFRGFTLSLVTGQPADVDAYMDSATAAGARVLKPAAKSLWGYGGAFQAPDGTVWTIATSNKKSTRDGEKRYDEFVLLLGPDDVGASKRALVERGFEVSKSFGGSYVEFATSPIKLALNKRKALAKNAGIAPEGSGSHRLAIHSDAGAFTDADGFAWEPETQLV